MLLVTTMEKLNKGPIVIPSSDTGSKKKTNPVKRMIKSIFGSKNK